MPSPPAKRHKNSVFDTLDPNLPFSDLSSDSDDSDSDSDSAETARKNLTTSPTKTLDLCDQSDEEEDIIESTPPQKRKRGRKKSTAPAEPVHVKITYILSIFSAGEMKKKPAKRMPKSGTIQLSSDKPWDTLKAQLLHKIDSTLKPKHLDFTNYTVSTSIPRIIPKPGINISSNEDYICFIQLAQKTSSQVLTAQVSLIEKEKEGGEDKENADTEIDETPKKAKKKKTDPLMLPGNIAKAKNIQLLQDRWRCEKATNSCVGIYCYVPIDPPHQHLPLNNHRLDCWASAMLKGDVCATIDRPPNHHLFDASANTESPVLQRRREAQQKEETTTQNFTFSIGDDIRDLAKQIFPSLAPVPQPAAPLDPAPPAPPATAEKYDFNCPTLLQPARKPGLDMNLEQFCTCFDLDNDILTKLRSHGYKNARTLRFLTADELKTMDFRLGEIAAMRDAIESWSN
ncbi:hypothetical protein H0H93_006765 [Arthromyces matolae]|nr:hypothetical protein H0H93_006765 [Arthromyces matolae]